MRDAPNAPLRLGEAEWGLMVLQSMLWGSTYFFVAVVEGKLPILTLAALRCIPAAAALMLIVLSLGYRLPATWGEWRIFIFFSIFNTLLPFLLIVWGQGRASGGMAAILNAMAPVFGIFLAHLLTHDEKLSWLKLGGILLGVSGVAILVGYDFALGSGADVMAKLALLGAPICYVLANIFARARLGSHPPFVIAMMQMVGAVILAVPIAVIVDQPWTGPAPTAATLGAIVAMGVLGSALAPLCHFTVLRRAGAVNASLVTLIMPLTPIVLGGIFLGDRLSTRDMIGAGVIAAALILIDGRLVRRSKT